jgi:beta-lactamase superfamily II metal-dependent hydrolase
MLNVTPKEGQADCHLIVMPDGSNVLVDASDGWDVPGAALAELQKRQIGHLALVVITHFHTDHYGRLRDFIKAGIKIDRVVVSIPDEKSANFEIPWGCNLADVKNLLKELEALHIPYHQAVPGERIYEVKQENGIIAGIDVLCVFNGNDTPVGRTDVNDTSILLRLFHGPTRALLTGDLGPKLGTWIANSDMDLRADLIKVPHHGGEGCVPNLFFDRVGAKAALVSAPKKLWRSPRSLRVRNYFINHEVPFYVSGVRGHVTATLTKAGYSIETER